MFRPSSKVLKSPQVSSNIPKCPSLSSNEAIGQQRVFNGPGIHVQTRHRYCAPSVRMTFSVHKVQEFCTCTWNHVPDLSFLEQGGCQDMNQQSSRRGWIPMFTFLSYSLADLVAAHSHHLSSGVRLPHMPGNAPSCIPFSYLTMLSIHL
eukprot:scaffold268497_cov18-Tisochrysis_lutea.AAC.1